MNLLNKISVVLPKYRSFSSSKIIEVISNEKTNVTTISLQRFPVNSLNTEILTEIKSTIDSLEKNKCKGLILTSNIPNIFTAGLDLMEFYKTDKGKLTTFWTTLQNTWLKLYTAPFPTVALINGHSPAGACLFAISCDYRVMLGPQYTIGLNEAKIGIPVPFWFMDVMKSIIGDRQTEMSVLTGHMFKTEEAFKLGLIDEVVQNIQEGQLKANSYLERIAKIAADCHAIIKMELRKDNVDKFLRKKEEELEFLINFMFLPQTQKKLELYFKSMKKN